MTCRESCRRRYLAEIRGGKLCRRSKLRTIEDYPAAAGFAPADDFAFFLDRDRAANRADDGSVRLAVGGQGLPGLREGIRFSPVRIHYGAQFIEDQGLCHRRCECKEEKCLPGHMTTPTVTQNGALYFAQHKVSQARAVLLRRLRKAKGKTARFGQLTFGDEF